MLNVLTVDLLLGQSNGQVDKLDDAIADIFLDFDGVVTVTYDYDVQGRPGFSRCMAVWHWSSWFNKCSKA